MKKMGEAFDRLLALTSVIPGIIVALLAIGVAVVSLVAALIAALN